MFLIFCLVLLFMSSFCLALAMPKHYRQWFSGALPNNKKRVLRISGWGVAAIALTALLALYPLGLAITYFLGGFSPAVLSVAFANSYLSRKN